jgi:hypothetical protein
VRLLGDDTVHTTVFDRLPGPEWPAGCTGRAAANATTRRWHGRAGLDAVLDDERERYRAAAAADDLDTRVLWAGERVDHIDASCRRPRSCGRCTTMHSGGSTPGDESGRPDSSQLAGAQPRPSAHTRRSR